MSIGKKITPQNQRVFVKGMGVIDIICILNYSIHERYKREKGSMRPMFVDLKAAFNSFGREEIDKTMEKKEIREVVWKGVTEILRERNIRWIYGYIR